MASTILATDGAAPVESSSSAVNWGPIIAGAFAASTLTFILMLLGSGLGLTMVSPWSNESASVTTFAVSTAIWLVIVQWLSSGLGGYLTGRLRTKWVGIHTDETFFRDTAHGFMAWALATLLVVFVLGSALSAAIGTGVKAASTGCLGRGDHKRRERRRQRRGVVFRRCAVPPERSFQAGGAGRGGRCDSSRTSLPHPHYECGGRRSLGRRQDLSGPTRGRSHWLVASGCYCPG